MRFTLNQQLFAVQFIYSRDLDPNQRHFGGRFRQPMLWDNELPIKCNFVRLTVASHHKVCNEWDEKDAEPKYDGFLLKDENGTCFANQYPRASYGQTSDEGDRRFNLYSENEGEIVKLVKAKPDTIYEYHLLSDVLERIRRGIKDLADLKAEDAAHAERIKEKVELLPVLYDRIVKDFHEAYLNYEVKLEWAPAFEGSDLIWPDVTFVEKTSENTPQ